MTNVDRSPPCPPAVEQLQAEGMLGPRCRLRRCLSLHNMVEPDRRVLKQRVWLAKGDGSFHRAWRPLQGVEAVHLIRKGRARWVAKGDAVAQARSVGTLFGLAAQRSSVAASLSVTASAPSNPRNRILVVRY